MNTRFLIFDRDSPSYHCGIIFEGVRKYFADGDHPLTFLPIGISEMGCFGNSNLPCNFSIVCWMEKSSNIDYIRSLDIPYLNLFESNDISNQGLRLAFEGEGHMAAKFFIDEMNFESLAFIGASSTSSHHRRFREFREIAEARGVNVEAIFLGSKLQEGPGNGSVIINCKHLADENKILTQLLRQKHKPMGIFCANDRIALNLYYRAQYLGINVPEKVSILGVGSHQKAEEGGVGSISVIQMDHIRQGYRAAQLLEKHLCGEKPNKEIKLFPDGIVHRNTTTRKSIKDPLARKAFEIISEDRSITVNQLSERLSISRDALRRHIYSATNMSIAKFIDLERFKHAKQLLRSYRYSHEAIASLAGYRNHKQMIRSFDRFVQMSPKQFAKVYLDTDRK